MPPQTDADRRAAAWLRRLLKHGERAGSDNGNAPRRGRRIARQAGTKRYKSSV